MRNVVRTLTLLLLLTAALSSCSMEEGTKKAVSVQIAPPLEAALDRTVPEVSKLLKELLVRARSEPESGIRRGELGMAYEVNGFPDAAITSYQQAEALDESDARWPYFQALILASRGEQQLALQALDRTIAIDASYAPAWLWRGIWSLDLGLLDYASDAFLKADSLGIGAIAIVGQARVSLHKLEPDEALTLLEPLSRQLKHPNIFQLLGRAYREAGRSDDARIALTRAQSAGELEWADAWHENKRTFEASFNARASNAHRLLSRGESEKALQILESLITQQPDNEVIINNLSIAYRHVGEQERAFWILRKALVKHPDYYSFHYNIADFYDLRGNFDRALMHVNQAITLNPTLAAPYTRKGLLLMDSGKYEEALTAFESALNYDAGTPQVFLYAGQVEATLKRWPKAIQRFEESVRVDPSFTLGHINLASGLAHTNRFEEARVALERAQRLGTHEQQVQMAFRQLAEQEASSK